MKTSKLHLTPSAEIEFTDRELELLAKSAEHHYDWVCQTTVSKAGDGRVNGLLTVMLMKAAAHRENGWTSVPSHFLRFREVDTLCKVAENLLCHRDEKDRITVGMINFALHGVMRIMNQNNKLVELSDSEKRSCHVPEE